MKSLRKLIALVLCILAGTALTVEGYLESRLPGKPQVERAVLTSSPGVTPALDQPEADAPACCKRAVRHVKTS